jgi:hypothetical protein
MGQFLSLEKLFILSNIIKVAKVTKISDCMEVAIWHLLGGYRLN